MGLDQIEKLLSSKQNNHEVRICPPEREESVFVKYSEKKINIQNIWTAQEKLNNKMQII